jgi:hypothetical protein
MSKLARNAFNKKYSMPDNKVMGTISNTIAKKLTKLVITGDKDDIIEIIDHINTILGTRISDISADVFPEPFTSESKISQDYQNPTGIFFLVTQGEADLIVGTQTLKMIPNKILFVNERNVYNINKPNKTKLVMLSGRFIWDKEKHGET